MVAFYYLPHDSFILRPVSTALLPPALPVGLVQRFLALQLFIPVGVPCGFEFGVCDSMGGRRRVFISSAFRTVDVNPLHAKLPLDVGHQVQCACARPCRVHLCTLYV